jgi:hypothetical protein
VPFGQPEVAVLFRPALMLAAPDEGKAVQKTTRRVPPGIVPKTMGAVDAAGRFVRIRLPNSVADDLATIGQEPGTFAIFGMASLGETGLVIQCHSVVVSPASTTWTGLRGPFVPASW